jgi:hypothetical protein
VLDDDVSESAQALTKDNIHSTHPLSFESIVAPTRIETERKTLDHSSTTGTYSLTIPSDNVVEKTTEDGLGIEHPITGINFFLLRVINNSELHSQVTAIQNRILSISYMSLIEKV